MDLLCFVNNGGRRTVMLNPLQNTTTRGPNNETRPFGKRPTFFQFAEPMRSFISLFLRDAFMCEDVGNITKSLYCIVLYLTCSYTQKKIVFQNANSE